MTMIGRRWKYGESKQWSALIGRQFDSGGECRYAEHLFARQANGEIERLEFQVPWEITINGVRIGRRVMRVDFRYFDKRLGETVWDEFKGFPTPEWLLKRDLWAAGGPGILRVTRAVRSRVQPYIQEDIWPAGMLSSCHKEANR